MAKNNRKLLDIMLAIGMISVLAGILLLFVLPSDQVKTFDVVFTGAIVLLSAAMIYVSVLRRKALWFYIFLNLCIVCLVSFIAQARGTELPLAKFWPLATMLFGLTLFPVGFTRYKGFKIPYVIPAMVLVILSLFFMLFTFDVIEMPLSYFFGRYGLPVVILIMGVSLLFIYYFKSRPVSEEGEFPEDEEDHLFEDEE